MPTVLDDALAAISDTPDTLADTQAAPSYKIASPPSRPATQNGSLGGVPFDEALRQATESDQAGRTDQLNGTVALGTKQDSARSTKILQLYGQTGLPRDFIERNLDFVDQETAKQGFNPQQLMQDSPAFASWLSEHPDHVAAARPDATALSFIEKQLRNIPAQFEQGQRTVEYGDVMLSVVQGLLDKTDITALRKRQVALEAEMAKPDETGLATTPGISGVLQRAPGWMAQQLPILSRTVQEQVKAGAEGVAGGALLGGAVGGLPGAAVGGVVVGGAMWRVGAAIASAKMEFAQAFGEYEKLKDAEGNALDQQTAMGLAGMVGVVNGAIDGFFGIEGLTSKLPGINQFTRQGIKDLLVTPTTRAAVLAYAKTVGQVMVTEGVTEAIQMYITKAGGVALQAVKDGGSPSEWLGKIFSQENLSQALTEAEAGAFGGGGIATVMATPGLAQDISKVREANRVKQAFESIGKAVEGTKMSQDLPGPLRDIIERATKDGPVETLYVPEHAFTEYFQKEGVDPREVYQEITGDVDAYDQAVETGADLPITTADYVQKLAGTKHNEFLARELRTSMDAMNAREAADWVTQQDAIEQAAAAQTGVERAAINDPGAQVRQDIAGQLTGLGFDPAVVDQYAALFESRYKTRAERRGLGETAAELFAKQHLLVTKPLPEILKTLGTQQTELDALLTRLRSGDLPKPNDVFGQSLTEFLKEKGGLVDTGGELKARNVDAAVKPFTKKLVRKTGKTLDEAAQMAVEAGYLEERDIPKLLDALDQEARGTPIYAVGKENARALDVQQTLDSLKAYLDQRGIDLATATNADIKKLLGEAVQQTLPTVEGQTFAQGIDAQANTFFSQAEHVLDVKMPNKASAAQIKGILSPENRVKPDELKWIGMDDFLKTKDTFTKEEVLAFVKANEVQVQEITKQSTSPYSYQGNEWQTAINSAEAAGNFDEAERIQRAWEGLDESTGSTAGQPKFASYQLPGGTNYRELLLTLPDRQAVEMSELRKRMTAEEVHPGDWQVSVDGNFIGNAIAAGSAEEAIARTNVLPQDLPRRLRSKTEPFRSSHFAEPNILAHVRFNTRTDANGKRVLFLEEVQSDWHQKGKREGYSNVPLKGYREDANVWVVYHTDGTFVDVAKSEAATGEEAKAYAAQHHELTRHRGSEQSGAIPDAPFKKTWHELALKRMLRYAAEHGYDELAWTTGAQQAERYDLSKHIKAINYRHTLNGKFAIQIIQMNDEPYAMTNSEGVTKEELVDMIGKDATDKIAATEKGDTGKLTGLDLKVGGEGMKGFYDQILPAFMNKYGKKWGAKVGEATIKADNAPESVVEQFAQEDPSHPFVLKNRMKVPAIPITDSMKQSVLHEGQPLFQGAEGKKGSITFGNQQISIQLLEKADLSTFIHETGHLYLNELIDDATTPGVSPQLGQDLETILKWMGLDVQTSLGAAAIKAAIQPKHHEQFARGFEAYTMEGKSPSQAMREVFAAFRQWLIQAYRSLTTAPLNVRLTQPVREVMDRMLATDEEIDRAAQEAEVHPLFTNAIAAGMSPTEFAAYREHVAQASLTARETLQKQLMAQYQRQHEQWWTDERDALRLAITERVNQQPEYVALSVLQTGTMPDGSPLPVGVEPMKLDRKALAAQFGQDFLAQMPKGTTTKNGMHQDAAAQIFGFNSGQELVMAIVNARPKVPLIHAEADQQMQDRHGDMRVDGTIAEAARAAVMNDHQEQVIAAEIRALNAKQREVAPFVKAAKGEIKTAQQHGRALLRTMVPTLEETRTLARKILARTALKMVNPFQYSVAARQASKHATAALAKQEYVDAGHFKQRELLNLALFREATIIKQQIEQAHELATQFGKPDATLAKSRNVDLINVGRAILAQYGLARPVEKTAADYLAPIKTYDQDLYDQWKPQVDALAPRQLDYNALTVEEFTKLHDDLSALWLLSRRTKQIQINDQLVDRQQVIDELSAVMAGFTPAQTAQVVGAQTTWADTKLGLLSWQSALRRVESWVDGMDSGNINGIFRRYIWTPISEASDQFRAAKKTMLQQYLALIKPIETTITRELIAAPELGPNVSFRGKTALLHAILHTGNESNESKLLRGYHWDAANWTRFVERMIRDKVLTKADYDYAQGVWDLLESIKPQAQQAHHEMYGYYFSEITATPIQTPWGAYKGGYVPAIADRAQSVDQAIREEKDLFDQAGNSYMFPTTGRGFTKARVEAYAAPLALDLTTIPIHLDKTMRFVHLEPRVKDAARLITNKQLRTALDAMNSTVAKDMLVPWLQHAAQQTVSTPGRNRHADQLFRYLRKATGAQIMVGNVVNTLQQLTGFSLSLTKVKARYLRGALVNYLRHPITYAETIASRSAFMKGRSATQVIEIQQTIDDILLNPTKYDQVRKFAERHGYFLQQGTQNIVDVVTWGGAYDQAVAQNLDERMAVRAADAAVRQTQGTFAPEDLSAFEAGTPFTRAFTMFYSYFNMQANLLGTEFGKVAHDMGIRKGAGRAFYLYLVGFLIPAVLAESIVKGLGGFDPDDDDDYLNEALSVFFGSQLRTALALFPGVGPITLAGVNMFNSKWYDDRISTSPVVSLLESAVRAPHSLYQAMSEEGHSKRAVRDVLTLLGLVTGLPLGALTRPVGYLADVTDGVAQPESVGDVARGLLSGKDVNRTN